MKTICCTLSLLLALLAASRVSAAGGEAFTDAASAGPDFAVQGEYLGGGSDDKWGAQVVALGDGKFDIVGHRGGLPGEGWKRGDERKRGTGELKDGVVSIKSEDGEWSATIKDGMLTVVDKEGQVVGELKKVKRSSPTLGTKPPAGATVLFDGSSADNFVNGKLIEGNLLSASNPESKLKLGDHTLHIEFRTPFMPKSRGQARGNSGVYIQGRYECQVLDSFGLEGENNECGGIYSQSKPAVNMCLPPLAWQTYDIDFVSAKYDADGKKTANARATIRHNGVAIYENLEIGKETPGHHAEGPGPDHLYLQDHGNPVAFRNIWVVDKK